MLFREIWGYSLGLSSIGNDFWGAAGEGAACATSEGTGDGCSATVGVGEERKSHIAAPTISPATTVITKTILLFVIVEKQA